MSAAAAQGALNQDEAVHRTVEHLLAQFQAAQGGGRLLDQVICLKLPFPTQAKRAA